MQVNCELKLVFQMTLMTTSSGLPVVASASSPEVLQHRCCRSDKKTCCAYLIPACIGVRSNVPAAAGLRQHLLRQQIITALRVSLSSRQRLCTRIEAALAYAA